jgi:ribokinase
VLTGEEDPASAAIALVARTGAPVVITLGAEGALVADNEGRTSIAAPSVVPVDATGAGDAFNGVLSAALAGGASVHEAVQRAVVAASLSTQRIGAQAGMPTRAEVEATLRT